MQLTSHRTEDPRSDGLNNWSANPQTYDSDWATLCPNPYHCVFELQSGDVTVADHEAKNAVVTEENVKFLDENQGIVQPGYNLPPAVTDGTTNTELANFLKRPVRIWSKRWLESDFIGGLGTPILPWHLFFSTPQIKYKLNNYAFIRCNLKIKVVVNASPFYYGAFLLPYHPLHVFSPHDVDMTLTNISLPNLTTRPHMWIYPQNSEGGEMTLPFIYPKNWLRIQSASDFQGMGKFDPMIAVMLQSASGVTGIGVDIQMYAWAEDVEISGTSCGLALQTRDEFDTNGVVSGPATAVATAAGKLRDVPGLGKFATAAEVGASSIAKIASMFGFSNTPNISPTAPIRPSAFPSMSSAEQSFPTETFGLDPKNGVSIDPTHVGAPAVDPLAISSIIQRESVLTTTEWTSANAVDDILFSTPVNPGVLFNSKDLPDTYKRRYLTPLCLVAQLFKFWRGDIIFRFRIVASQYHKGRLRLVYDPAGYPGANIVDMSDVTPVVQTVIMDIGKDTDVSIRVPYNQALAWLNVKQDLAITNKRWKNGTSPSFSYTDGVDNGFLALKVTTGLTANAASTSVNILVSVCAADNFEFGCPCTTDQYISPFAIQTKDEVADDHDVQESLGSVASPSPDRFLLHFGENIVSLRSLLQRTYLHSRYSVPFMGPLAEYQNFELILPAFPTTFGYDPWGKDTAKGLVATATNFNFNFANVLPVNLVTSCFLGWRGSMVWTFNPSSTVPLTQIRAHRTSRHLVGYGQYTMNKISPSADTSTIMSTAPSGSEGQQLTNQQTQAGLSVTIPFYTNYNFYTTAPYNGNVNYTAPVGLQQPYIPDGSRENRLRLECWLERQTAQTTKPNTTFWNYTTIGDDFSPVFFLCVPELYFYSSLPPGV